MVLLVLKELTDVIDATLLLFTGELTDKFKVAEKLTLWVFFVEYLQTSIFSVWETPKHKWKWNSLRCAIVSNDKYVWNR